MKSQMNEVLNPDGYQQYSIIDELEKALENGGRKIPSVISVKSGGNKMEKHGTQKESHKNGKTLLILLQKQY